MHRARRDRLPFILLSIVVLLLWLGAALVFSGALDAGAGTRTAAAPPFDAAQARAARAWQGALGARLGANLDATELTSANLDARLAGLADAGYRWVRFTLPWDEIEPQQGQYDWSMPDALFAALARYPTLQPVVVLNGSPAWARRPGDADNPLAPPQERADFGAFAVQVAQRYGEQVTYYQVWDEPNIAPHWGARPVDPADYLGLLREGAIQLRAADADAVILLGALAPTTESGGANLSDLAYLDALYGLGGGQWFDVVAGQPYGFSDTPDAPPAPDRLNFGRATLLHDVMVRHGQGGRPLWATAFGWNALPEGWAGPPSPWGEVTEPEQAAYAVRALELGGNEWGWLGPMFWATACPQRPPDDPWLGFALCDAAGDPRPAATALTIATGTPPVMPPGDHATDHPAADYSDGWRVTPSAADPSQTGDRLSLEFNGAGAALNIQGGPFWAVYRIWIDGEPANALPLDDSGAAYLILYDPLSELRVVTVARDLPPGPHRLDLTTEGGWGQWALQGFRITGPESATRNLVGWALLGLALLSTAIWALYAWGGGGRLAGRADDLLDLAAAQPDPLYWIAGAVLLVWLVNSRGSRRISPLWPGWAWFSCCAPTPRCH